MRRIVDGCAPRKGCRKRSTCIVTLAVMALALTAPLAIAEGTAPTTTGLAPLIIEPTDNDARIRTSVGQWGSYLQQLDQKKIDDAKRLAPEGLVLPKPAVGVNDTVDVWSRTDMKGVSESTALDGFDSVVGAGIQITDGLKLGVGTAISENDTRQQALARAELQAKLAVEKWTVLPQVAIVEERTRAYGRSANDAADQSATGFSGPSPGSATTRVELGQEVRRPFTLEEGDILEPFVNFSTSIGLDGSQSATTPTSSPVDKIGLGLSLSKADTYRLEAATDFDGLADAATRNVNSRVKLTVPLD